MNSDADIRGALWRAADILRGAVEWPGFKDYIFALLFFKFLSDSHDEKLQEYRLKYSGDAVRVARAMSRERFILPEGCGFGNLYAERGAVNLGERLNSALRSIQEANSGKLEGVFAKVDFNSAEWGSIDKRNTRLRDLLEIFAGLKREQNPSPLQSIDLATGLYGQLLRSVADDSGKQSDAFYTPTEVATLMVDLLEPKPGERIYDPWCGTGGLLIHAARAVGSDNFALLGQESDHSIWAMCRMNLLLHRLDAARVENSNAIRQPLLAEDGTLRKFDLVITRPPFVLANWDSDSVAYDTHKRFLRGVPPKSRGDYAFISHAVETMNQQGRVGIIVPHGALFRGGSEGLIRRRLIEENLLEGIIGLPPNLFFGTAIPAVLMVFRAGRGIDTSVFFIDASRGFTSEKNRNRLRDEDLLRIVSTWRSRQSEIQYAHLATREEIAANQCNLNLSLYVSGVVDEGFVDLAKAEAHVRQLERQVTEAREELAAALDELG